MTKSRDMNQIVCVVTGANSGIGKETARALALRGAHVVLVCRNSERGRAAQKEIRSESGSDQVDLLTGDMSSQASIRDLVAQIKGNYKRLDVLVNNAGAVYTKRIVTVDGIELTMALNHLGAFLLTLLLLDLLKASAPSRIVNISSAAHERARIDMTDLQFERKKYGGFRAYGQSKLMMNLFTVELARRLKGTGVTVNSVHPGVVSTEFGSEAESFILKIIYTVFKPWLLNSKQGSETGVYVATSPQVSQISGEYFVKSKPAKPNPLSLDPRLAGDLWQLSEQLVGIR
jgi:NAD(P)-dependent dehydrogenase (short-subunit alcohol dehydrogenase family)